MLYGHGLLIDFCIYMSPLVLPGLAGLVITWRWRRAD